jgi:hypothetical protein
MCCTCLYVSWLIPVYSWKSLLRTSTDINSCGKARCPGGSAYRRFVMGSQGRRTLEGRGAAGKDGTPAGG